mmetsp:Transcript_3105/g.7954  ORF Transcript_3105/g.7954 Transcript_3105/m.7954 type:complete len:253 (+) Transcript_3105:667-1425(+)
MLRWVQPPLVLRHRCSDVPELDRERAQRVDYSAELQLGRQGLDVWPLHQHHGLLLLDDRLQDGLQCHGIPESLFVVGGAGSCLVTGDDGVLRHRGVMRQGDALHADAFGLQHLVVLELPGRELLHFLAVAANALHQALVFPPSLQCCAGWFSPRRIESRSSRLLFLGDVQAALVKLPQKWFPDTLGHVVLLVELDGQIQAAEHVAYLHEARATTPQGVVPRMTAAFVLLGCCSVQKLHDLDALSVLFRTRYH